jgi:hypothetical protein
MGDYYSVRVWQLKPGASAAELEALTASGILEMQRWIPDVKHLSLIRLSGKSGIGRYLLITTFADHEAYKRWRQVEEEGPDYWERYASVLMHWEQLSALVEDYVGEAVVDASVEEGYK